MFLLTGIEMVNVPVKHERTEMVTVTVKIGSQMVNPRFKKTPGNGDT